MSIKKQYYFQVDKSKIKTEGNKIIGEITLQEIKQSGPDVDPKPKRESLRDFLSRKFDKIENDILEIKQDISGIKTRLDRVEQDIVEIKQDISGIKTRLDRVEQDVTLINTRLDKVENILERNNLK